MYGQGRAAAWCGRLLLFAALLVGIVAMHTLGHPSGHGAAHGQPSGHDTAHGRSAEQSAVYGQLTGHGTMYGQSPPHRIGSAAAAPAPGPGHHPAAAPTAVPSPVAAPASVPAPPTAQFSSPADSGGMDPSSVCLAVLSFWTLLLLTAARLLGRRTAWLLAAVRARLLRALWPIPPPRRQRALAQLSVLRI
jgi:hypothetical protein